MKAVRNYVLLLSLGVLASVAASASTLEQTYLDNCRKGPGVPVPISVVKPAISQEYTGSSVDVEFTVDETGKPANLTVKSHVDETLSSAVLEAVKQWKFKPAERNGVPVATKVVLPVKVVEPETSSIFAAN